MNCFNLSVSDEEKSEPFLVPPKKKKKKNERFKCIFSQLAAYAGLFVSSKRNTPFNSLRTIDL